MLMEELHLMDVTAFKNFTRMSPKMSFALLERLRARISKKDTFWREAISPGVRLALVLSYYDSYKSMAYNWLVADGTISKIVREVVEAIIAEYAEDILSSPVTLEYFFPDKS